MDFLESLSVRKQLLLLAGVLLILFFAVRANAKNNRKKRLKNRNFGERIKSKRKQDNKDF